jgi:hypothetical protein
VKQKRASFNLEVRVLLGTIVPDAQTDPETRFTAG